MIRFILYYSNLVHYYIFQFFAVILTWIIGLPLAVLFKNRWTAQLLKERKIMNPYDNFIISVSKPDYFSLRLTFFLIIVLLILIESSIIFIIAGLLGRLSHLHNDWTYTAFLFVYIIPCLFFGYLLLLKNDRYIIYFKEFDRRAASQKTKDSILTFAIILLIATTAFGSYSLGIYIEKMQSTTS